MNESLHFAKGYNQIQIKILQRKAFGRLFERRLSLSHREHRPYFRRAIKAKDGAPDPDFPEGASDRLVRRGHKGDRLPIANRGWVVEVAQVLSEVELPQRAPEDIIMGSTQAPASIIPAGAMDLPARRSELEIEQLAQSLSRVAVAKSSTADDTDMDNLAHAFSATMAADMNTLPAGTTLLQKSTNAYPVSDAVFQVPIYFHKTYQPNSL
ncbi:hypothetical protein DFP72DRAFT_1138407 [Ephemerocybe angulata]|uniref:Uncharacterized protein n=1 Tax=Ephemerocybe angulata TaxID=980116 RepID=A0A8H6HPU8_9AGAR|nr:hypothetical protein DFP72DRAFT_1138407 [Tulosesus angulatus]